ncbi:S8 family serine peptidase [Kitasatospora sp. NPDC059827]|uniref:S8 family serine peptidase n=1 Tax=Kitasatospora sp. NPDC059827 TaxID=3346964 RepID=UPI00364689CD
MSTRRAARAAALCTLAALGALGGLGTGAPPAAAAGPAGSDPSALPVIGQSRQATRPGDCLKPSDKGTDRTPWAQTFLRPEAAWPLSRGAGVSVAVVGSGVDPASGVLGERLLPGPREYGTGDSTRDCVGHGTFLAGLIAARHQDGTGFAGIAPEARILAVAVTDDTGNTTPALLAKGIRDAADAGARIIASALPLPAGDTALDDALRHADTKGVLVVAPATPDQGGANANVPSAPPQVLTVAALAPGGGAAATGADGSARTGTGTTGTGTGTSVGMAPAGTAAGTGAGTGAAGARVDLSAPGEAMMSTGPAGKGYFTGSGPSFATAVVAGTAALLLGQHPDLDPAHLRERLEATAYHPGTALPDPRLGYGTVDPLAALTATVPPTAVALPAPRATLLAPPPPDPAPGRAAAVAVAVLTAVTLTVGLALLCTAARRRAWRPGRWQA